VAIYHFSAQVLGRVGKRNPDGSPRPGSRAVAAAAYRSGERLTDHARNRDYDYSQRKGVVHSEILTPPGSAPWLADRTTLWNTVEQMEKRKDAQLAREFNMALPHELSHEDRVELVRDFVETHFVRRGMVADIALHDPIAEQGQNRHNFHAHVMLTLRRATASGLDAVKTREWNSKELLNIWRAEWAVACNRALERGGHKVRIDHRTLVAQRDYALDLGDRVRAAELNRQPEIHVGPKARQIVRHQRTPVSRERFTGATRRREGLDQPQRRVRVYPAKDIGNRLDRLAYILSGNNERLRRQLQKDSRRFDRLNRKIDYWARRATFYAEGQIKGREFRFLRWQAAKAEQVRKAEQARRLAHARKRLEQARAIMKLMNELTRVLSFRREKGLLRTREVEGWIRNVRPRDRSRSRGRSR